MLSVQSQPTQTPTAASARTPQPTRLPPLQDLDFSSYYFAARTGGDFFDALALGPHVVFLLTDIAGTRAIAHTTAAATQDTFRRRVPELFGTPSTNLTDAVSILAHDINHTLTTCATGVCFAPTFLACYDQALGVLAYINAGGQPAIFRDADSTRILPNACMPLGLFTHLTYEPAIQVFEPGARLLLLTKGVILARSGRTPFGIERAIHLLQDAAPTTSALDLCNTVVEQAHQYTRPLWYALAKLVFTKPERADDLTAVVLARPS
jgi:serine phosphatase RsbU (regulator of sigma subunit)